MKPLDYAELLLKARAALRDLERAASLERWHEAQMCAESASWATIRLEIWFDENQREGQDAATVRWIATGEGTQAFKNDLARRLLESTPVASKRPVGVSAPEYEPIPSEGA